MADPKPQHQGFLSTTAIFVALGVLIIVGSIIMSHFSQFNPMGAMRGVYHPEIVYTPENTHEVLTNTCKFPYQFLMNDDVEDGRDDYNDGCLSNELTDAIRMSSDGVLTLQGKPEIDKRLDSIRCTYYKHSGISNQSVEIQRNKPQKVPYFNFAVSCKKEGIVEYLKPFVNFAVIPKETLGESVAVLFLPKINHKTFMKFLPRSKRVMMTDNRFLFSQMSNMQEPRPFHDLLLQLGVSSETSLFQKAKLANFTTFFAGPQQLRELIDVDYDTLDHRNFVFQFLIDDKKCLEDGRRFVDDQLERFRNFLSVTKGSKFFSTFFIDDFGVRKKSIDFELSESLQYLENQGVFENTTLIITSYDLSDDDTIQEDDKNPLLAVRVSDNLKNQHWQQFDFLTMNFNRLLTTTQSYLTILNLLEPNSPTLISPWSYSASILRTCEEAGLSESMCLCMNMSSTSEYPKSLEEPFLISIQKSFEQEVKKFACVKKLDFKESPTFYEYKSKIKGEVHLVELSADVTLKHPFLRVLPLRKTFTFEPMFRSYRSHDTARVQINYGVNVGIARLCYL